MSVVPNLTTKAESERFFQVLNTFRERVLEPLTIT